jgi:Uma2 family endonuclease
MPPAVPTEPILRITVEQYHDMIKKGILAEDAPVELLEGWLVPKMSKNPPHLVATVLTRSALDQLLSEGFYVQVQDPVTTDDSEPEPDIGVVRGKPRDFSQRLPRPADMGLVIEVSESSLTRDRTIKKRIFARAQIPVYWIINLVDRQLEVYTDPSGPGDQPDYRQRRDYGPADLVPVVLDGKEIGRLPVRDLLP